MDECNDVMNECLPITLMNGREPIIDVSSWFKVIRN
jgi:hypothetical protein